MTNGQNVNKRRIQDEPILVIVILVALTTFVVYFFFFDNSSEAFVSFANENRSIYLSGASAFFVIVFLILVRAYKSLYKVIIPSTLLIVTILFPLRNSNSENKYLRSLSIDEVNAIDILYEDSSITADEAYKRLHELVTRDE